MASFAYENWIGVRATALDEIEAAHLSLGGAGPGRRTATQQINQAYAVMLSSQFQGFCGELHSEAVDFVVTASSNPFLATLLEFELYSNRKIDRGNPNPGNLGADFGRFYLPFWREVEAADSRNPQRMAQLIALNDWRNAIAHQDFDQTKLGGKTLQLQQVRTRRSACNGLALSFDIVLGKHLANHLGKSPW